MTPDAHLLAVRPEADSREIIAGAVAGERRVELLYMKPKAEAVEQRLFSPYELIEAHRGDRGRWVPETIVGWDHERRDYRTYRLDRIRGCALIDVPAYQAAA